MLGRITRIGARHLNAPTRTVSRRYVNTGPSTSNETRFDWDAVAYVSTISIGSVGGGILGASKAGDFKTAVVLGTVGSAFGGLVGGVAGLAGPVVLGFVGVVSAVVTGPHKETIGKVTLKI